MSGLNAGQTYYVEIVGMITRPGANGDEAASCVSFKFTA